MVGVYWELLNHLEIAAMFTFHIDDAIEAERLEVIALDMGATRINQEGWATAYGGNGILMFIESRVTRREWKMIISGFSSVTMA